jgi:DMSO/TMAO reductase YedYZ molybdopterin-dependent catalytic subunit
VAATLKAISAFVRRSPWQRFVAGAIAGGGALIVTLILRTLGLGIFLPEVAVEFTVGRIPGEIESFFIRTLGEGAKLLAIVTAVAVFLALPGIYAILYRRVQKWLKRRWLVIAFFAFSSAGIILLGILPLLDAGFFGSKTPVGPGFATFSQLLGSWVYAAVLDYFFMDVAARYPEGFNLSRRQFLIGSVGAIALAVLALYGFASLSMQKGRLVFASIADMFAKEVTPTSEFYVVTKNVIDPTVDANSWDLSVGGMVANPMTYRYADLLALADPSAPNMTDTFVTLECVSNDVGGNLISSARWNGVRLSALLQSAGLNPNADWIVFTCADGYTAAIPLSRAMSPNTMVAVRMNGAPLVTAHGFPARIIVPGLYGMFHAKWLTKIEATQGEYLGYWQQKGWTNRGLIHTTAIIATPADSTVVHGSVRIGGVALAGDRGISSVEVSVDGGSTWSAATLSNPRSNLTWVLWTFDWTPPRSGSFRIVARAVDGTGAPQEAAPAPPFPNGSAGYDSITLLVS